MHIPTSRIARLPLFLLLWASVLSAFDYQGYFDQADCDIIGGWAYNGVNDSPVTVVIYNGTTQIAVVQANNFRGELAAGGKGDGYHGWAMATPDFLKDGQPHTIHAKYQDTGAEQPSSPATLACSYDGWVEHITSTSIGGWAVRTDLPNTPITVDVYDGNDALLLGQIASINRSDLFGNGNHAFDLPTPGILNDGQQHYVSVRYGGKEMHLGNSPWWFPGGTELAYGGWVENVSCTEIRGWAYDSNHPNTPVSISFYDGSSPTPFLTVTANLFRQDLLDAGVGDGAHGFVVAMPPLGGGTHHIAISADRRVPLFNSPWDVTGCNSFPGDFSLSLTPASAIVSAGASVDYTVTVSQLNGFGNQVSLQASGLPTGTVPQFNPTALNTGQSTMTVSTSANTPAGTIPFTVIGTSGGVIHTASALLTVNIAVTVDPATVPTLSYNQAIAMKATVMGSNNQVVTWSRNPVTCGTLQSVPGNPGPNYIQFIAPPNLSSCNYNTTVTVTATSQADPSRSASTHIVLTPSGSGSITLTPSLPVTFTSGVAPGTIFVSAPLTTSWSATSNVNWIILTGTTSGIGGGAVPFTIAANGVTPRSGTVTVGGQTFTANQYGSGGSGGGVVLTPSHATISSAGGSDTISVSATASWSASSPYTWIRLTSGSSGNGPGAVAYSIDSNSGGERAGSIMVDSFAFPVTQGAWTPILNLDRRPLQGGCTAAVCYWEDAILFRSTTPPTTFYATIRPYITAGTSTGVTVYYRPKIYIAGKSDPVWRSDVYIAVPLTGTLYIPGPLPTVTLDAAALGFGDYFLEFDTYATITGGNTSNEEIGRSATVRITPTITIQSNAGGLPIVGQKVVLTATESGAGLAAVDSRTWSFADNIPINNYEWIKDDGQNVTQARITVFQNSGDVAQSVYFTHTGQSTATYTVHYHNGSIVSQHYSMSVVSPQVQQLVQLPYGEFCPLCPDGGWNHFAHVIRDNTDLYWVLSLGVLGGNKNLDIAGFQFAAQVNGVGAAQGGQLCYVQLVNGQYHITFYDGTPPGDALSTGGNFLLDKGAPYGGETVPLTAGGVPTSIASSDLPYFPLISDPGFSVDGRYQFRTFLMYMPPGDMSIWVALLEIDWGFAAYVQRPAIGWSESALDHNQPCANPEPNVGCYSSIGIILSPSVPPEWVGIR